MADLSGAGKFVGTTVCPLWEHNTVERFSWQGLSTKPLNVTLGCPGRLCIWLQVLWSSYLRRLLPWVSQVCCARLRDASTLHGMVQDSFAARPSYRATPAPKTRRHGVRAGTLAGEPKSWLCTVQHCTYIFLTESPHLADSRRGRRQLRRKADASRPHPDIDRVILHPSSQGRPDKLAGPRQRL